MAGVKCRDLTYDMFPQCRVCAGVLISCLNRDCLKVSNGAKIRNRYNQVPHSAPKHLPANINQKGCNLVVDSHVLGQRRVKKLSYHWGGRGPSLTDT